MVEKQNGSEKAGKSNQQPTGISMSPEQAVWFAVKLVHDWKTFKVFECKMFWPELSKTQSYPNSVIWCYSTELWSTLMQFKRPILFYLISDCISQKYLFF